MASLPLRSNISLGVVPTHIKFVGGLVPDENGRLPRNEDGELTLIARMRSICAGSPVTINETQIPLFPGVDAGDIKEWVSGLNELGLKVNFILMVGGADPMSPQDEDAVCGMLVAGLKAAIENKVEVVSSTSVEEWMKEGAIRKEGADFDAAVAQNVKVHCRALKEAGAIGSCIKSWHIEFLRGSEFETFTDIGRIWEFIKGGNKELGQTFFKVLADAAHCGDSTLSIPENEKLITDIAAAGELGIFHASAKTTRGCLSSDDGWIGALLTAAAKTGKLETVLVELFHHEDDGLGALRDRVEGHGVDTRDGRSYDQVVYDGLESVARRLNNLVARGILPSA